MISTKIYVCFLIEFVLLFTLFWYYHNNNEKSICKSNMIINLEIWGSLVLNRAKQK